MEKEYTNSFSDNEASVRQAAQTDYLTGLPNRRGVYEYFCGGIKSDTVHCMFIDIDNFKKVNDTYGHKAGDELLVSVSRTVKGKIGDAFFARLGGDEFVIIIDGNVPQKRVIEMAQIIIDAVDEVQISVDVSSIISFSIGIMLALSVGEGLDDILFKCDVAMYEAKKGGKGKYVVYNDIAQKMEYRFSVNKDKYSALKEHHFKIYFQPRINSATMGVEGVNAQIYWEHPTDGLRHPKDFIGILEEDGFIVELEKQMFEELCGIMQTWKGTPLESLVVNVGMSKKHLYKKDFIEFLDNTVEKYGLKPESFCIGLDEIENHPKAQQMIKKLKKEGYDISCIKGNNRDNGALLSVADTLAGEWVLDKSLVKGLGHDRTSMILAKGIISLARELNIHVAATDVEEKKELDFLSRYGCDIASGAYFSEALEPDRFMEYALSNTIEKNHEYSYELDGSIKDQNGGNEGKLIGEMPEFIYDSELGRCVLSFPGTERSVYDNTLEIPKELLNSQNYSISVFFKADDYKQWNAVVHIDFENGFASIIPSAWDGVAMFRVKDKMYEEEWPDAIGKELKRGRWYYVTVTYNAKKQEGRLYVDGELQAVSENAHKLENPLRIVIGGDAWQGNMKAEVGRFVIRDYVITADEARAEYKEYAGGRGLA